MQKLKWKSIFLTVSLSGFAIAILDQQPTMLSYLSLPVAAILFELFLITTFLEKESALYDEQKRIEELARDGIRAALPETAPPARAGNSTLIAAHSD